MKYTLLSAFLFLALVSIGQDVTRSYNRTPVDDSLRISKALQIPADTASKKNNLVSILNGIPYFSYGGVWKSIALGGAGGVTSVGLSMPGVIFNSTVTNSPVTSSGILTPTLANQTAYTVFARGTGTGTPTFLSLDTNYLGSTGGGIHSQLYNDARYAALGSGGGTSSQWTTVNVSDIYYNSGNVGIATSSPKAKLDVNGTFRVTNTSAPTTGAGLELQYVPSSSGIYSYDRTASAYKELTLDGSLIALNRNSNAVVQVGSGTPSTTGYFQVISGGTAKNNAEFGSIGIQSAGVNNCWFGDNIYYNGGFLRRAAGYTGQFYFAGAEGQFRFGGSNTAGSAVTAVVPLKINFDQSVSIGGNQSNAAGTYTGATVIVNSTGVTYATTTAPATPAAGSVVEWYDGTNKRWKKSDGSTGIIY